MVIVVRQASRHVLSSAELDHWASIYNFLCLISKTSVMNSNS
jgi:hypothetical protein